MIKHGNHIIELDKMCEKCNVQGHLLCYMSDMSGATHSKKDGFARYIIDNMMENGELLFNQPVVVNGFQKFTHAVGAYLSELGWTSELYAISHAMPTLYRTFLERKRYENTVMLVTEYVGHYPKEYSEEIAREKGAVFIDQYSNEYGVEYYTVQALNSMLDIPYEIDAFINPNATGATTKGFGGALKTVFKNMKIYSPNFMSSGNPDKGGELLPPLLRDFDIELFDKNSVDMFLYTKETQVEGIYFNQSWKQINFGLTYLKNNPNKTVLLHIGG